MKALKWFGYTSWFGAFFGLALLFTFPLDGLRPMVVSRIEDMMGKGKQGQFGHDPVVTIGELGLAGLNIEAKRVHLQLASKTADEAPSFDIDKVKVSAALLSLLGTQKTVQVEAALYGGDADADVTVDDKGNVTGFDIELDDIDLGKVPALMATIGMPLNGVVNGRLKAKSSGLLEKDGEGSLQMNVKNIVLGPGTLRAGMAGSYEFPESISLGDLVMKVPVKAGTGTIEILKLDGTPDLQAELTGTAALRSKLLLSRIDLEGWFRPTAALLQKNEKIRDALELAEKLSFPGAPSLSKAKDEEGHYHFTLRGPMQAIQPALSTTAGKKGGATRPLPPPRPTPTPVAKPVDADKPVDKPIEKAIEPEKAVEKAAPEKGDE